MYCIVPDVVGWTPGVGAWLLVQLAVRVSATLDVSGRWPSFDGPCGVVVGVEHTLMWVVPEDIVDDEVDLAIRRYVHARRAYRSSSILHQNLPPGSVTQRQVVVVEEKPTQSGTLIPFY